MNYEVTKEAVRFLECLTSAFHKEHGRFATTEEMTEIVMRTNRDAMLN